MSRKKNNFSVIGQRFGSLTVIDDTKRKTILSGQTPRIVDCICDCGNTHSAYLLHVIRGRIQSCGCNQKVKNGESATKLHKRWKAMHERCEGKTKDLQRYAGRGIKVCDEWHDYFVFKNWALKNGYSDNLQIDRIDNNGNYTPENCRFVPVIANANNKEKTVFVNYKGHKKSLCLLMDELGIDREHYSAIRGRIIRGWDHQAAIDTPIRIGNYKRTGTDLR